jgi:hypothetical protein
MNRKRALWLIIAVLLLAVAFYLWGSSHTPAGQPALVSLNPTNVAEFQRSFNAAAASTRIVLLVSPT